MWNILARFTIGGLLAALWPLLLPFILITALASGLWEFALFCVLPVTLFLFYLCREWAIRVYKATLWFVLLGCFWAFVVMCPLAWPFALYWGLTRGFKKLRKLRADLVEARAVGQRAHDHMVKKLSASRQQQP
jgi:hypothetical protein